MMVGNYSFGGGDPALGVQLFTVAPNLAEDFEGTLAALAAIGYRTVETAGLLGRTAAAFRAALDAAGLRCTSMHVPGVPLLRPAANLRDDLDAVARDAATLGAAHVVMPMFMLPASAGPVPAENPVPFVRAAGAALDVDDYLRVAAFLNDRGALLAAHGLRLGYHNHGVEFLPKGERMGIEILIEHTDPALVSFELDVGWAVATGVDPVALLRAHPGRFTQVHLKDVAAAEGSGEYLSVAFGQGAVDLPAVIDAARAMRVEDCFLEQEPPFDRPRLEAIAHNWRHADALLKAHAA